MTDRERKTALELELMLMEKIRERDELDEIQGVAIRRIERRDLLSANWDGVFQLIGFDSEGRAIPVPIPHPLAYQILGDLQSRFDLAP